MELTRRDALLALAGGGLVASAAFAEGRTDDSATELTDEDRETLLAIAEVLYPSSVTVTETFVETYVLGRQAVDGSYLGGLGEALTAIRATSRRETGRGFASNGRGLRNDVLRETGADRAYADPDGTVAQRIRYYVVDELLYALYTTPKGAELVGSENPKGYPGGVDAYQRTPMGE